MRVGTAGDSVYIFLQFTSKQLERLSKKGEKDQHKEQLKVKKVGCLENHQESKQQCYCIYPSL